MKIILDAFGGDNAPVEIIKGAVSATNVLDDISVILVGRDDEIFKVLKELNYDKDKIEIRDAQEVITAEDSPVNSIRQKKNSSMVVALNMLKNREGDAVISAGNTGAYLAGAFKYVGRIKGVKRPALTTFMPTIDGRMIALDVGANADCKPEHLMQFGIMGSYYAENILGIKNPRVGLVNVGTEDCKGNELTKEAFKLMKECKSINFIGNIEARQIPYGDADVIVSDGFTGNIILKLTEGVGMSMYSLMKGIFLKNMLSKISAMMIKSGLKDFKKRLDYTEYGGAPLLGVDGIVFKAHGSSNAKAICNAIKSAKIFYDTKVNDKIREQFSKSKDEE